MPRRVTLASTFLVLLMAAGPANGASSFRQPEQVSPDKLTEASLAVLNGRPHIAGVGPHGIWYFTRQGGVWSGERVTYFPGDINSPRHAQPAIAVDPMDGSVTIAFERRVPEDLTGGCETLGLRWTSNRSGDWPTFSEVVGDDDASSNCMVDPALVVRNGHMYVAGEVSRVPNPFGNSRIRYLTDVTGDWTFEDVRGSRSPSLLLDQNGNPQIAAQRNFPNEEDLFEWTIFRDRGTSPTGDFVRSTIVSGIELVGSASLALATNGKPRVAWSEPDGVHYAVKTGAGWNEQLVAPGFAVTDLIIDPLGVAHMAATGTCCGAGGRLWYLTGPQNGGAGDFDAIDVTAATDSDFDIGAGLNGRVQISFQRGDEGWWVRSTD